MKLCRIIFTVFLLSLSSNATVLMNLYGNLENAWSSYGGNNQLGTIEWTVDEGKASVSISVDAGLRIAAFSFNTNVTATDFTFDFLGQTNWNYSGLSTSEGYGTDLFDFTIWRPIPQATSNVDFKISGLAFSEDWDIFRESVLESNPYEWDRIVHRSHFGVFAFSQDGRRYILSDIQHSNNPLDFPSVPEPTSWVFFVTGILLALARQSGFWRIVPPGNSGPRHTAFALPSVPGQNFGLDNLKRLEGGGCMLSHCASVKILRSPGSEEGD